MWRGRLACVVRFRMRYFIMLLSTDWFWPFWSEIGLDLVTATKARVQVGCREIVRTVIGRKATNEEGEFEYIDWSESCELQAKSRFEQLVESVEARTAFSIAMKTWIGQNIDDHMGATMILRLFTHELIEGAGTRTNPVPDFPIRAVVTGAMVDYDIDPAGFEAISTKSTTIWDQYLRSLFDAIPDQVPPTALATYLDPAVRIHRARMLWSRIREKLSVKQRHDLLSWYYALAKTRMP